MPRKPTLPQFRPFQLATLVKEVPKGEGWLFETKFDGYRCQASIAGDQVRLYSRGGHDWSEQFAGIAPALRKLTRGSCLIDGEVIAQDEKGRSNFSLLKATLHRGGPVTFFAFDILEHDGEDLAGLPLIERKARLEALLGERDPKSELQFSSHIVGHGLEVFEVHCAGGYEGIIAKRANARYVGDRAETWLKIKCVNRQEFIIVGWRPDDENRKHLRSLILATNEGGRLVYRGRVGTGFTDRHRREVQRQLEPMAIDAPDVEGVPRDIRRRAYWVRPELLAEVEYTELTSDGTLRHPSFKGIREDKVIREVRLEQAHGQ